VIKDKVVKAALAARTLGQTETLEGLLRDRLRDAHYRFVDDNEGNWSSITSGAEPTALIFERVTNMFDTLIDLAAAGRSERKWTSPDEAVRDLFNLPDGVDPLTTPRRAELAKNAAVTIFDSDDSKRKPTLTFRDHGTGLTGKQMPTTILSLNRSPKLTIKWAHGVFGKGGTTASQYSDATIIITRRQPDLLGPDEEDRVSVAVMRKGTDDEIRMPFLHYIVGENEEVYSVPASEAADFEPGTYIAHINYELGQAGVETWKHDQSIYAYAETILFRPVLPYTLRDARSSEANTRPSDRQKPSVLSGLGRRLTQRTGRRAGGGNIRDHSAWSTLNVDGVGTVRLRWWLFEDESSRRRMAARRYSALFTSNGQTHHAWDSMRLQTLIPERRRVGARLLVEIDCDEVPIRTRVELFTSDRNAMRSSTQGRALEAQVVEAIEGDLTLLKHEEDALRKALKAGARGVTEAFLDRLNRAIKIKTAGLKIERTDGNPPPPPPPPVQDLYPEPTYLEGPETITALRGKAARVYLRANAHDGFVPDRATVKVTTEDGAPPLSPNIGPLRDGRLRVSLQVPADAEPGTYKVNFSLTWRNATRQDVSLDWDSKIEVVTEIKPKKGKEKKHTTGRGSVAFMWSRTSEQNENHWTNDTAGDLQYMPGKVLAEKNPKLYGGLRTLDKVPTVVLNEDFGDWANYRQKIINRRGTDSAETRTNKYGIAVGSAVAVICGQEQELITRRQAGREVPDPMSEEQQQRAVAAAARTALVLLPDLDLVLGDVTDTEDQDGTA
jgi:hypothetical protein